MTMPRVALVALLVPTLALAFVPTPPAAAGESALTVADLAAYRAALSKKEGGGRPAVPVSFRELWSHPATYQGRRVQVEGRVIRRFRQGAFGTFPPLEEAWTFSLAGDPFCLVFPETKSGSGQGQGGQFRFVGTFLKLVEYRGGDGPRLAPLIVGPGAPVAAPVAVAVASDQGSGGRPSRLDWALGSGAAVLVALVLAHQHLRRPVRRPAGVENAPPPLFDDAVAPVGVSDRVVSRSSFPNKNG